MDNSINNLYDLIKFSANRYGNKTYLIQSDPEIPSISFDDLLHFVENFSRFFLRHNVKFGSKVAILLPNSTLCALIILSIISSGRILIPINPKSGSSEIEHILNQVSPDLVLFKADLQDKMQHYAWPKKIIKSDWDLYCEINSFSRENIRCGVNIIRDKDIAEIVYTSGSTGRPKGVVITHENLITNVISIWERLQPERDDNFLTITPLFHNSGQFFSTYVPLLSGSSTAVVRPELALNNFWKYVAQYETVWTLSMPTHINYLLLQNKMSPLNKLKGIMVGGAQLDSVIHEKFQKTFDINILKTYGLTETCSFATCDYPEQDSRKIGASGKPLLSNEIKIYIDGQLTRQAYVQGEIYIKGKNVISKYFNDPLETERKISNGWFASGDLGYFDEHDNIYIVDRLDSMVTVNGENVYPSEVENLIPILQGVDIGVLSSIPNNIFGNELILVYEGIEASENFIKDWITTLREKLVNYKVPTRFINVSELGLEELPKADNGKILRKKIKIILAKKFNI